MLGLGRGIRACLFDLDGVLTQTAKVHAAAWKRTFDEFLRRRAQERGADFVPFDLARERASQLVDEAADALERRVFFDQLSAHYETLRADPDVWSEIEAERARACC